MTTATQLRPCIGCDIRPVEGRTYCSTCRERLRRSLPCDLEHYVTAAELERVRRVVGAFSPEPNFNRPPPLPLAQRLRGPHRRGRR